MSQPAKLLDLITVGRSSVDLYGQQVGGRLEDMSSFAKFLGGSPANTATGAARLGLRAGLLTRVGADHMGRFIREQLVREGVDVMGVIADPSGSRRWWCSVSGTGRPFRCCSIGRTAPTWRFAQRTSTGVG